jgi:hypothetical protein
MLIACWITKATNAHSEYVTFIAFLLQQRSHERASLLPLGTLHVLFIVFDIDVPVSVGMEVQQWVLFILFTPHKVFRTTINNNKYYKCVFIQVVLLLPGNYIFSVP